MSCSGHRRLEARRTSTRWRQALGVDHRNGQHDNRHGLVSKCKRKWHRQQQGRQCRSGLQLSPTLRARQRSAALANRPRFAHIDRMNNCQKPDRIGHHPVIKLHGQRVLKKISPCRRLEPQSPGGGTSPPSISGHVLKTHTGIKPRHQRAEIDLQQHERRPGAPSLRNRAACTDRPIAAAPAATSTRSPHRSRRPA